MVSAPAMIAKLIFLMVDSPRFVALVATLKFRFPCQVEA
jgi:hypothetical protein